VTDTLRIRLSIAYDGAQFSGWAIQPGLRTVEGVLQAALATVLRLAPADVVLVVAGRTDAGVHATGQVAHVDVPAEAWATNPGRSSLSPGDSLVRRLAGVLPRDVRVAAAGVAPPGFDARFAALWRRYAYRVSDHQAGVDPLRRHDVLDHRRRLDVAAMDAAAAKLLGLNDFAAFCQRRQGATTIRTPARLRLAAGPGRAGGGPRPGRRVLPLDGPGPGRRPTAGRGGPPRPGLAAGAAAGRGPQLARLGRAAARADPGGGRLPAGPGSGRPGCRVPPDPFARRPARSGS
jgi:tRNA pseudouridine38-40 synthase